MSNGEQTKPVTTVGKRDISDQIVKQNHSKVIKPIKEDRETNNKQDQDSLEIVITVGNQDINKLSVEQGLTP
jgi:hypothetical protein